ncbi:MAG: effector-associated domain EAD1-containing protein [Bacteroidota bacterium]|nr:effector-associated domain EAD1-containing protein [Bacteroidota bacterium]
MKINKLDNVQFKEFQNILTDIYRTPDEFTIFVKTALGENRHVVAAGTDLKTIAYNLINWAEAKSRLTELISSTLDENPNNQRLIDFVSSFDLSEKDDFQENIFEKDKTIEDYKKEYAGFSGKEAQKELKKVNAEIKELENESIQSDDRKNILIITASPKTKTEQELINQKQALIEAQNKHTENYNEPKPIDKCKGFSHIKDLSEKYSNKNKELDILHISVHGEKQPHKLVFEDEVGFPKTQTIQQAEAFFEIINNKGIQIKHTVISACYSSEFAKAISNITKSYAIGMNNKIIAESAVEFLRGFYNELLKGEDIKIAFKSGLAEISTIKCTDDIVQNEIPELYYNNEKKLFRL